MPARVERTRRGRAIAPDPTSLACSRAAPIAPLANPSAGAPQGSLASSWTALGPWVEIAAPSMTPVGIIQVKYRAYNPFFCNVDERRAIGVFNATDI